MFYDLIIQRNAGSGAVSVPKAVPQKRSHEDLMGGGSSSIAGTSTVGFGERAFASTAAGPSSNAPWPLPLSDTKKQKTAELSEKSMNAPAVQQKTDDGKASSTAVQVKKSEAAPLPAFLQPAVVAATYSSPKPA